MGQERQLSKRGRCYQSTRNVHSPPTEHHTYSKSVCTTNTDILHIHTRSLKEKQRDTRDPQNNAGLRQTLKRFARP